MGDILDIIPGDSLTFDGILIKGIESVLMIGSHYLEVDESMITGQSESLKKRPFENISDSDKASTRHISDIDKNLQSEASIGDLSLLNDCYLRAGCNVFEGYGTMIICAVGE